MKKIFSLIFLLTFILSCSSNKLPFKGDGFGGPQNEKEAKIEKKVKNKPVILVHGLYSSSDIWFPLRNFLLNNGYNPYEVYAVDYKDTYNWLMNEMQTIRIFIKNVRKYTGRKKIVLAGHSKGGILVRMYLQMYGGKDVTHAVTFASPNQGTPKSSSPFLKPGSNFIKGLNSNLFDVKYLCFRAETDMYFPGNYKNNAFIKGAKNVMIPGTNHVTVVQSRKAFKIMLDFIKNNKE